MKYEKAGSYRKWREIWKTLQSNSKQKSFDCNDFDYILLLILIPDVGYDVESGYNAYAINYEGVLD